MCNYKDGQLIPLIGEDDGIYYIKGHIGKQKAEEVLGNEVFGVSNLFAFWGFGLDEMGNVVRPLVVEDIGGRGRFKVTEVDCNHKP